MTSACFEARSLQISYAFSHALPFPVGEVRLTILVTRDGLTEVVQNKKAQSLLAMELGLLWQAQVLHRRGKRVQVPVMKVGVKLECKSSFDIVLGLKVHLWIELSVKGYISDMFKETYVDQLVYILDVDLVASNAANEVH